MPAHPSPNDAAPAHGRCVLHHPVFTSFGSVVFRPAEADATPVMVIPLGGSTAAIPLGSLQQEFRITPDSHDGRMLRDVAHSLDFVAELRPGDPLPLEVLDGGASWQPGIQHQRVAEARLRLQLVSAFSRMPDLAWPTAPSQLVLSAVAEPGLNRRVQSALAAAAPLLHLADPAAAGRALAAAAHELGFVEALRDRLLRRVGTMLARLDALGAALNCNLAAAEMLSRVRRLAGIADGRLRARFGQVEDHTREVLVLLRDFEACCAVIRLHRDWLYSSLRAWEGILVAWEGSGTAWSPDTAALLRRTYRFLAPRFMPVQEWQSALRERGDAPPREPMVW